MATRSNNSLTWLPFAASIIAVLAACGGGGGDSAPPASATKAEGLYSGTLTNSSSSAFQVLVLENDELWTLYGTSTSTTFLVDGFVQGQGASNNGSFTSSNAKNFGNSPPDTANITATYVVNTSISGSYAVPGGTVSFSGTPIVASTYNYNTPANLAAISGNWRLTNFDGTIINLAVAASGTYTGTAQGCSFTGTLTPRPSGKNVFNGTFAQGAAPCSPPNQTGTGVALTYLLSNGSRELIFAIVDAGRTEGFAAFGTR